MPCVILAAPCARAPDARAGLRTHPPSQSRPAPRRPAASSGRRLHNPYADLNLAGVSPGTIDTKAYRVSRAPEFLFQEEAKVKTRSWSENVTYYTGMGWAGGALVGASVGAVAALRAPAVASAAAGGGVGAIPQSERLARTLRYNRVLNAAGSNGRKISNILGTLGLLYAFAESGLQYARDGEDDWMNTVAAGVATGGLYRAGAGPVHAARGAVAGAGAGAVAAALKAAMSYLE